MQPFLPIFCARKLLLVPATHHMNRATLPLWLSTPQLLRCASIPSHLRNVARFPSNSIPGNVERGHALGVVRRYQQSAQISCWASAPTAPAHRVQLLYKPKLHPSRSHPLPFHHTSENICQSSTPRQSSLPQVYSCFKTPPWPTHPSQLLPSSSLALLPLPSPAHRPTIDRVEARASLPSAPTDITRHMARSTSTNSSTTSPLRQPFATRAVG